MRILLALLALATWAIQPAAAQPELTTWPERYDAAPLGGSRVLAKAQPCEAPKYSVTAGSTLQVDIDSLNAFRQNTLVSSSTTASGEVSLRGDTLVFAAMADTDGVREVVTVRSCVDDEGQNCTERAITVSIGRAGTLTALDEEVVGGAVLELPITTPDGPLFCGSITEGPEYEYSRFRELRFTGFVPGDRLRYQSSRASGVDRFDVVTCNTFGTCDTTRVTFRVRGPRATLPFFDDFSYDGPRPDASLWIEDDVFVNDAYGVRAPSYGVATFDGLDGGGQAYGTGVVDVDQLTTAPIDLSEVGAGPLFLKYYIQTGGRGQAPEEEDTFFTQFRKADGTWVNVNALSGSRTSNSDTVFRFNAFPIEGPDFRHADFQVRFKMRANAAGSFDEWNLDYVRIEQAIDSTAAFRDIALSARPPSPLTPYTRVPYSQFAGNPDLLREELPVELWNHFPATNNILRSEVVVTDAFGIELLRAGLLTGAQFNLPPGYSRVINPIPPAPLADYRAAAAVASREQTESLDLRYVIGNDQEQSRLTGVLRNDTASRSVAIRNEFAYDDGSAETGLRNGAIGDRLVVRYELSREDTLRALRFAFPRLSDEDGNRQLINLHVYIGPLGDPDRAPDYKRELVRPYFPSDVRDTLEAYTTYRLQDEAGEPLDLVVPAGEFYVGLQQASSVPKAIRVGVDVANDNGEQIFAEYGQGWQQFQVDVLRSFRGSLMVRPVFSDEFPQDSSPVSEAALSTLRVYPNPSRGVFRLDLADSDGSADALPHHRHDRAADRRGCVRRRDLLGRPRWPLPRRGPRDGRQHGRPRATGRTVDRPPATTQIVNRAHELVHSRVLGAMGNEITVQTLKRRLDAGERFKFVDVREQHEYDEFNIGAELIPLGTVPDRLGDFGDKGDEIVLHCRSGARSGNAQSYLESRGFTNVHNVKGGVLAWKEAFGQ